MIDIRQCHEDLLVICLRPDRGGPDFAAGQYTVLGLGNGERRVPNVQDVFNCGGPEMIGLPLHTHDSTRRYPTPKGLDW